MKNEDLLRLSDIFIDISEILMALALALFIAGLIMWIKYNLLESIKESFNKKKEISNKNNERRFDLYKYDSAYNEQTELLNFKEDDNTKSKKIEIIDEIML